ncbi:MAG: hypothetical protein ACLFTQ_00930 [Candidatus Aenigmatarchaeota archaeon]
MSEIKEWIEEKLREGYTPEQLKESLRKSGWNPRLVDKLLEKRQMKGEKEEKSGRFSKRSTLLIFLGVSIAVLLSLAAYGLYPGPSPEPEVEAPVEPAVETMEAENITYNSAVLQGNLTNMGDAEEVEHRLEYTSPDRDHWKEVSRETHQTTRLFEEAITGLKPDTSYTFKAVASWKGEEIEGEERTLTTDDLSAFWTTEISNCEELQAMKHKPDGTYYLEDDVDCSPTEEWNYDFEEEVYQGFEPIGTKNEPFTGTLHGQGNVIKNLYINRTDSDHIALFGYIDDEATVENVNVVDTVTMGNVRVAVLVGTNRGGSLQSSRVSGEVKGEKNVGGAVGYNSGEVAHVHASGSLNGQEEVGGVVGYNSGDVVNSRFVGEVSGDASWIGGIVGSNTVGGSISGSYFTGDVEGGRTIGGSAGANAGDITDSYAIGDVEGSKTVGGLVGWNNGSVKGSYNVGEVEGEEWVGSVIGWNAQGGILSDLVWDADVEMERGIGGNEGVSGNLEGKTTEEMVSKETYKNWNFDDTWDIAEDETYPYIQWQEEDTYPHPSS